MDEERQLTLHSPVLPEPQTLLVKRISGNEGLSQLFEYDVTLVSRSEEVEFKKVLGEEMCVGLRLPSGEERFFHGYVSSFAQTDVEGEFFVYSAKLRPHLWRLTRNVNCRIFPKQTVPAIVEGILRKYGIDFEPHYGGGNRGPYLPWEYCVQYRETDFAFVSRLLEYEGLHYAFKHEKNRHQLIIADGNLVHEPVPGYAKVDYTRASNMANRRHECVWSWRKAQHVHRLRLQEAWERGGELGLRGGA
jgi:type VI secretion system secreted protein VgrG